MPKLELTFQVDKVVNGRAPGEDAIDCKQVDDWSIPYRGSILLLSPISDEETKKFGPGQTIKATFEF